MAKFTRLALYGGSRGVYGDFSGRQPQDIEPEPSVTGIKIMMSLNKAEYGVSLYVDMGEDVSAATDYTFVLEPYIGDKQEKVVTDGVALGTVNITVDDTLHVANEYLTYTIKDGDLDQSGLWRIRGTATMTATKLIIGDYSHITVLD